MAPDHSSKSCTGGVGQALKDWGQLSPQGKNFHLSILSVTTLPVRTLQLGCSSRKILLGVRGAGR